MNWTFHKSVRLLASCLTFTLNKWFIMSTRTFPWLLCLIHLAAGQQTLLFQDTLSDSTNFAYSGGVTFISDAQCLGDGHCARVPASNPPYYFQTKSGAISTLGYTDIQVELQLTLIDWSFGSTLSIYWKSDASTNHVSSITSYDHDDLTQNILHTLSYDLSGNLLAKNNANFGVHLTASYNGNSSPYVYLDSISVYGTADPSWISPTTSPTTFQPTNSLVFPVQSHKHFVLSSIFAVMIYRQIQRLQSLLNAVISTVQRGTFPVAML